MVMQYTLYNHIAVIKPTIVEESLEVDNLLASVLLEGLCSHSDNIVWMHVSQHYC